MSNVTMAQALTALGIDVASLDQDAIKAIGKAAKAKASKVAEKAQTEADRLLKWECAAKNMDSGLSLDQREAICGEHGGSIRLWYHVKDGQPILTDWRSFKSRSANGGGSNEVEVTVAKTGKTEVHPSAAAACKAHKIDYGVGSAYAKAQGSSIFSAVRKTA